MTEEKIIIEKKAAREYFFRIGLALLLLRVLNTGIQQGVQYLILGISPELYASLAGGPWFLWALSILPLYLVALPVFWLTLPKKPMEYSPKKLKLGNTLGSCVACVPLMYIGNIIGIGVVELISRLSGGAIENQLTNMIGLSPMWLIVLCGVIIAPIGEELIFRKLLLDRLAPFGEARAILFSGLVFGLFHGNFNQFFYTFAIGTVLAFAYVKTKNLLAPIIMHMFFNLLGSVIAPLVLTDEVTSVLSRIEANPAALELSDIIAILPLLLFALAAGSLFVAGIALLIIKSVFIAKRKFPEPEIKIEGGAGRALWANAGIIVALSAMAATFILYLI